MRTTGIAFNVKLINVEYGQSLKERTRECEKLSNTLEKQQDSALRKLNQLNETYDRDKKSSRATIDRLESSEKELTTNIEKLREVGIIYLFSVLQKLV